MSVGTRTQVALAARIGPFFDVEFYIRTCPQAGNDPIEHYLTEGWQMGYDPGPDFSTRAYLRANPDVAAAGINPLVHYVDNGRFEQRAPKPPAQPADPMPVEGAMAVIRPHFDAAYYLRRYPDVAEAGVDPLRHFCLTGWREGRDPHPGFSVRDYQRRMPVGDQERLNPFVHFIESGGDPANAGALPGFAQDAAAVHRLIAEFDEPFYRAQLPDNDTPFCAITHYLEKGAVQGLRPHSQAKVAAHLPTPDQISQAVNSGACPRLHFVQVVLRAYGISNQDFGAFSALSYSEAIKAIRNAAARVGSGVVMSGLFKVDMQAFHDILPQVSDQRPDPDHATFAQMISQEPLQHWLPIGLGRLSDEAFGQVVEIRGLERLQSSLSAGKRVLMIGAHHGCTWASLYALARAGVPLTNIAQDKVFITNCGDAVPDYRSIALEDLFPAAALARASKHLADGGVVNILPDAIGGHSGHPRRFLGRLRRIPEGFAYLALTTADEIFTLSSSITRGGHIIVDLSHGMGSIPKGKPRAEAMDILVGRYVRFLEELWQCDPAQIAQLELLKFFKYSLADRQKESA